MRKVQLTASDFEMFDKDIDFSELEFFHSHKDAFKRMWKDQGGNFWISFIMTFRNFAVKYGAIKEFPTESKEFQDFVDSAFITIHENFVDAKVNQARNFIIDIASLPQNRHYLQYLDSKSFAKDPFYVKETRDVFRRLFGPPSEKSSYLKVYVLLPLFMKFGGAVCICLRRWLDSSDVPDGETFDPLQSSHDMPQAPIPNNDICDIRDKQVDENFCKEKNQKTTWPQFVPGWPSGRDPRRHDARNPLYVGPNADVSQLWTNGLTPEEYQKFFTYCSSNLASDVAANSAEPYMPGNEWLFATANADCEDPPGVASYEEQVQASRAAYQHEFAVGRRDWPLFVPDWPSGKDPRFYDRGNPLYNPLAERGSDWRSEVSEQEYTRFYVFVKMKYGKTPVSFPREVIEEGRAVTGTFADDGDDDDAENTSTEQTKAAKRKRKRARRKVKVAAEEGEGVDEGNEETPASVCNQLVVNIPGQNPQTTEIRPTESKSLSQLIAKTIPPGVTKRDVSFYIKGTTRLGTITTPAADVSAPVSSKTTTDGCSSSQTGSDVVCSNTDTDLTSSPDRDDVASSQAGTGVSSSASHIDVASSDIGTNKVNSKTNTMVASSQSGTDVNAQSGVSKCSSIAKKNSKSQSKCSDAATSTDDVTKNITVAEDGSYTFTDDPENDRKWIYITREKNGHWRPPAAILKTDARASTLHPYHYVRNYCHIQGLDWQAIPVVQRDKLLVQGRMRVNLEFSNKLRHRYQLQIRVPDPCSRLEHCSRVLMTQHDVYSIILKKRRYIDDDDNDDDEYQNVDDDTYLPQLWMVKIQVLERTKKGKTSSSDDAPYWIFVVHGQVNNPNLFSQNIFNFKRKQDAIKYFELYYEMRTGNVWAERRNFRRYRGRYYPIDLHELVPFLGSTGPDRRAELAAAKNMLVSDDDLQLKMSRLQDGMMDAWAAMDTLHIIYTRVTSATRDQLTADSIDDVIAADTEAPATAKQLGFIVPEKNGHKRPPACIRISGKNPSHRADFLPYTKLTKLREPLSERDRWVFDGRLGVDREEFDVKRYRYLLEMMMPEPRGGRYGDSRVIGDANDVHSVILVRDVEGKGDCGKQQRHFVKMQVVEVIGRNNPEPFQVYLCKSGPRREATFQLTSRREALRLFEICYERRTGNAWAKRRNFRRYIGCYYPVDLHESVILEDGPPPTAMTSLAEERDKLLRSQSFGDFDADLDDDVVALTDDVERERDQYNDFLVSMRQQHTRDLLNTFRAPPDEIVGSEKCGKAEADVKVETKDKSRSKLQRKAGGAKDKNLKLRGQREAGDNDTKSTPSGEGGDKATKPTPSGEAGDKDTKPTPSVLMEAGDKDRKPTPSVQTEAGDKDTKPTPSVQTEAGDKDTKPTPSVQTEAGDKDTKPTPSMQTEASDKDMKSGTPMHVQAGAKDTVTIPKSDSQAEADDKSKKLEPGVEADIGENGRKPDVEVPYAADDDDMKVVNSNGNRIVLTADGDEICLAEQLLVTPPSVRVDDEDEDDGDVPTPICRNAQLPEMELTSSDAQLTSGDAHLTSADVPPTSDSTPELTSAHLTSDDVPSTSDSTPELTSGDALIAGLLSEAQRSVRTKQTDDFMEKIQGLRTVINFTRQTKQMSEDMDRRMREACLHPRKLPKKRASELENSEPHSVGDDVTASATTESAKPPESAAAASNLNGAGDATLSQLEKISQWKRDAELLDQCTSSIVEDEPRRELTKEQRDKAFSDLIDIMNLHDVIKSDDEGAEAVADRRDDVSKTATTACSGVTQSRDDATLNTSASTCVTRLPNLSDDAKVDLMGERSSGRDAERNAERDTVHGASSRSERKVLTAKKTVHRMGHGAVRQDAASASHAVLRHDAVKPGEKTTFTTLKFESSAQTNTNVMSESSGSTHKTTFHFDMRNTAKPTFTVTSSQPSDIKAHVQSPKAGGVKLTGVNVAQAGAKPSITVHIGAKAASSKSASGSLSSVKSGSTAATASGSDVSQAATSRALRSCASCSKQEPKAKSFKKCQLCKTEGVAKPKYYCSKDCQVVDWKERHKQDHAK